MTGPKTNERPGTRASVKHVRASAYKAREVLNQIRCLLYTSPSPRDQRGSRMPSSA